MLCKHCGKEIADEAVFCKYCGKRTDGLKTCPVCKKDIDDDSAFCSFCGADLTSPAVTEAAATSAAPSAADTGAHFAPASYANQSSAAAVKNTSYDMRKVLNIVISVSALFVAVFALIFIFFTGITEVFNYGGEKQSVGITLFHYFGKAYKNLDNILDNMEGTGYYIAGYYRASTLIPRILGTLISAGSLLGVCALSITSIVFTVQHAVGKREKSGDILAIAAFALFVFCASFILLLNGAHYDNPNYTLKVVLNSATIAGITLCSVFAFILLCAKTALRGKQLLKTENIVKVILALAGVAVTVVVISLFTMPALSAEESYTSFGTNKVSCNVLHLLYALGMQISAEELSSELLAQAWAVFGLGLLSCLFAVGAIICGGDFVIKAVNNITGKNNDKALLNASIRTACFSLVTMVLLIVSGELFYETILDITNTYESGKFSYGVPIAAFVLSLVPIGIAVALKIYGEKKAQSEVLPPVQSVQPVQQTAEQTVAEDTENSQS